MRSLVAYVVAAMAVSTAYAESGATAMCRTMFQGGPTTPDSHVFGLTKSEVTLSWLSLGSPGGARGVSQTAYTISVTDVDSKEVVYNTSQSGSTQVVTLPEGPVIATRSYVWQVDVTLSNGDAASCTATFDMAPQPTDFPGEAKWIGGGGQLRSRALVLPAEVVRARAYVTGVGSFYFHVNGVQVGNIMDPPQTVYSKTVLFSTFDITDQIKTGPNYFGAYLGTYKWGYTDLWCNMTVGGPNGCRALLAKVDVTLANGTHLYLATTPDSWEVAPGPVVWDHFFHGETFDGRVDPEWIPTGNNGEGEQGWTAAVIVKPVATAPTNMQVMGSDGVAVALGEVKPSLSPPLKVTGTFPAISVTEVHASDTGRAFIFDCAQNMGGMVRLTLPAGHGIPAGTELRIEHGEIVQGVDHGIAQMCLICPKCGSCGSHSGGASGAGGNSNCDPRGKGAVCDTYCNNPGLNNGVDDHDLRHEPCYPHQSYTPGYPAGAIGPHETPDRYIGDFNNANMTNVYIVKGDGAAETYTPYFAGAGFRYVQVSGFPAGMTPTASMVSALRIHSDVAPASDLKVPSLAGTTQGTPNVLQRIHEMTLASQTSNLWSIPTDCPQRERRGWMGDAQASCNEAMHNFDMMSFYAEFLNKIRDDQLRFDENHPTDTGALADVVPYDGIGGNPGCPVWQVAYIVIPYTMWKHYGEDALPTLAKHYDGMVELMGWFNRHADPSDGLLVTHCYGDWMGFHPESGNGGSSPFTPQESVTAFYHVLAAKQLSVVAAALGKPADAEKWAKQHTSGQAAFHKRYYDPAVGGYSPCKDNVVAKIMCHNTSAHGSQTSNSMALALGAPPDAATAQKVADNLANDVVNFGHRTTTGVVGIAFLFDQLDRYGHGDIGMATLLNDAYPSLGHMAAQNMTTLCENWACTYHAAGGGSQNHIMLGGFDGWVASAIGGLDSIVNETTGGWRHIAARVAPAAYDVVKEANYTKLTRFGPVTLSWTFDGTHLSTQLDVPIGADVTMETPSLIPRRAGKSVELAELTEGGARLWSREGVVAAASWPEGVRSVEARDGVMLTTLESGRYNFEAEFQ